MAIEQRTERLFGLYKGRSQDLHPRTRVVLKNRSDGYEDSQNAGFFAERVSVIVTGSASVRRRRITRGGTTEHPKVFNTRERTTLRRRDVDLASDWSLFGTRTLI